MPTDPYTGTNIEPGTPIATCPRGHINRADSWAAADNRCSYPGCGYVGRPTLGSLEAPPPRFSAVHRTRLIRQRSDLPPSYITPGQTPPLDRSQAGQMLPADPGRAMYPLPGQANYADGATTRSGGNRAIALRVGILALIMVVLIGSVLVAFNSSQHNASGYYPTPTIAVGYATPISTAAAGDSDAATAGGLQEATVFIVLPADNPLPSLTDIPTALNTPAPLGTVTRRE